MRRAAAACLAVAFIACISCRVVDGHVEASPTPPPGPTLSVFVYAEQPKFPLVGASVVLVTRQGSEVLGVTDSKGFFLVEKSRLREPGSLALLFCYNQSPSDCSAVRLDAGTPLELNELNVNVPNPKVIDRRAAGHS